MWRCRSRAGFTLIELMITVAIIGILASIAVPSYFLMIDQTHRAEAKGLLGSLYGAEAAYFADQNAYGCFTDIGWRMEGHGHFAVWLCDQGTGCTPSSDTTTGDEVVVCPCVEYPKDWAGPGTDPDPVAPTDIAATCAAFRADQVFEADTDNWCRRAIPTTVDIFWITSQGGRDPGFLPYENSPPDLSGC